MFKAWALIQTNRPPKVLRVSSSYSELISYSERWINNHADTLRTQFKETMSFDGIEIIVKVNDLLFDMWDIEAIFNRAGKEPNEKTENKAMFSYAIVMLPDCISMRENYGDNNDSSN